MSKPCEFVFAPMKLTVRDSVTQIENNVSESEASIQSRTALNAGEMENSVTDQLEAGQRRESKGTRDFLDTRTSSRRRCQYQEGEELRKCCNKANRSFCTLMLFKSQDWFSTSHGYHTPLQDDGDKPTMDLAQSLQRLGMYIYRLGMYTRWPRYVHRDPPETPKHKQKQRHTQKRKQTVASNDREHRDGCTN